MKKFSIISEASQRYYDGGTPFSNGHRSKSSGGFLESRHYLIDIDQIIYNDESIKVIVEKKFKADSKMGNILEDRNHFQRKMLLNLCEKIGAKLFINITSDNRYYHISEKGIKEYSSDIFETSQSQYFTYESDDSIFIEFRDNKPAAIIKRLQDGVNVDGLLDKMSKLLNVNIFKVDDINGSGKILFYTFNRKLIGSADIMIDNSQRPIIEEQWKDVYQKMNLW